MGFKVSISGSSCGRRRRGLMVGVLLLSQHLYVPVYICVYVCVLALQQEIEEVCGEQASDSYQVMVDTLQQKIDSASE